MAVSRISARRRNAFPSHLTRVRTIRIGLPQHVQFTTGRGLGGDSHLFDQLHQLDQLVVGVQKAEVAGVAVAGSGAGMPRR